MYTNVTQFVDAEKKMESHSKNIVKFTFWNGKNVLKQKLLF